MIIIELFAGSKRLSQEFKSRGHKVLTIDNNPKLEPDICIDILNLNIKDIPKDFKAPDIIWASPPCTSFSVASMSKYWDSYGRPKSYKTYIGLALALKTLEIIRELKPRLWFIENPRGMLRKQYFLEGTIRKTLTYCQYGDNRQKPTDIWTNSSSWIPRGPCSPGDKCHDPSPRGTPAGTQKLKNNYERALIPFDLCKEIVDLCEDKQKIRQLSLK